MCQPQPARLVTCVRTPAWGLFRATLRTQDGREFSALGYGERVAEVNAWAQLRRAEAEAPSVPAA
jgi:hypothetical protein